MPNVELYDYQIDAIKRMKNGCILDGGVGSGKSRTSLAYVYAKELNGKLKINGHGEWTKPKSPKDIYIITTAMKRDTREWDDELIPFGLSSDQKTSVSNIKVVIDSWNNIKKYEKIFGAVFIFDEDKVVGTGTWAKTFLKITRKNRWILLSASPGDTWTDYIYVFIANGFYRNKTEFNSKHIVYKPYLKYPCIDHYIRINELEKHRKDILVHMYPPKKNRKEYHNIVCNYNKTNYKIIWKERWDIYDNKPIDEMGKLCYLLRRVSNEDPDRIKKFKELLLDHPRTIVFYNFSPELKILRDVATELGYEIGERNGEVHTSVPTGKKWVYLVQYNSGAEGWNCITTDCMIFYSLNYSYKTMIQALGRIDRLNTKFTVLHYYFLKSKSPIDIAIERALSQKKRFNEKVFLTQKGDMDY